VVIVARDIARDNIPYDSRPPNLMRAIVVIAENKIWDTLSTMPISIDALFVLAIAIGEILAS
jgi:hypothetical protein